MKNELVGYNMADFHVALSAFDKAVCEACAVSTFTGSRYVVPYKGYSSHIFTRMCYIHRLLFPHYRKLDGRNEITSAGNLAL